MVEVLAWDEVSVPIAKTPAKAGVFANYEVRKALRILIVGEGTD